MASEPVSAGINNVYFLISENGSRKLATWNAVPGEKAGNEKYRIWDPYHSKLAALIIKGARIPLNEDSKILYLGAANGTTASYVSDIVSKGTVFAVEFSPRAMQDLIRMSAGRMNLIPIFADARNPASYKNMVIEVDLIYQDIAQREQASIAVRNAGLFLKKNSFLVLNIKSRSIDSGRNAREVTGKEIEVLGDSFEIIETINLEPFHHDHFVVIAQYR